jgi:hypothetical protein
MKKGIRITIDGASHTGKTLLAYAFSEFLRQNSVEDEQISFFNDGMPPREECQQILENAIANGVFKDTEFVFVERAVGRLYLVGAGIEGTERWQARPTKYSPIHQNAAHVDMEMGCWQPTRITYPGSTLDLGVAQAEASASDAPRDFSSAEVMERHYGLGSAKLPAELRLRPSTRAILEQARQANPDALNASAALLPHKTRDEMVAEGQVRLSGDAHQDQSVKNFLEIAQAAEDDEPPVGTTLTQEMSKSIVRRKYAKQHMLDMQNKSSEVQEYLQLQEFKCQALLDEMLKEPALVSLLGEFRIGTVHLIPPPAQESYLGYRKREFEDNDTLPQLDVFISRWDRQPVTPSDVVRIYTALKPKFPEIHLNRKIQNAGISGAHVSGSTPLFDPKAHSQLTRAGREALQAMTSQQARESSPILETLPEFGGVVLGHPLGQDNGDHNGELESGFKYQMQIHPLTGETREQMLVRAQSFIRGVHIGGGEMAFDYSNLPVDLVFDNQCGVRWKTNEEMAALQAEADRIFDAVQEGSAQIVRDAFGVVTNVFVPSKLPRGMNRSIAHIDDAGLWPGGVAPVASPADPVLKEQMDTVAANLLKVRD